VGRPKKLRWKEGDWGVTNPGLFSVSDQLLRRLRPDLFGWRAALAQKIHDLRNTLSERDLIKEQLWLGSIQAALVVSVEPGRVAAYSDELDCVAMLSYRPAFLQDLGLREGARLLTVNYYDTAGKHLDLDYGPGMSATCGWTGVHPIIADFLTDDTDRLEERKEAVPVEEWERTWELGCDKLQYQPGAWRSGRPRTPVRRV